MELGEIPKAMAHLAAWSWRLNLIKEVLCCVGRGLLRYFGWASCSFSVFEIIEYIYLLYI